MAVWTFLSGFAVPLSLFPGVWHTLVEILPFAGMVQIPVDIFLEQYHGADLALALATQLLWTLALLALGRWLLHRATHRLVVQGG
jgi:ABC-2 type transport system permease protein